MKKLIFVLLLSLTMGHVYSQNYSSDYIIDWKDLESITLQYPGTGNNHTFEIPGTATTLQFKFSKYTSDWYYRDQLTNYIIQAFSHIPYLNIEYITYYDGSGGIIELYLSENKESKKRRLSFDGGGAHVIIVQSPR